jgi:hypothetical protein
VREEYLRLKSSTFLTDFANGLWRARRGSANPEPFRMALPQPHLRMPRKRNTSPSGSVYFAASSAEVPQSGQSL